MIEDIFVKIAIVYQGQPFSDKEPYGYMTMGSIESGAVAFCVDIDREWDYSGYTTAKVDGKSYPSMYLYELDKKGDIKGIVTQIAFVSVGEQSLEGFGVHAVSGTKVMSICLTNTDKWFKDRGI